MSAKAHSRVQAEEAPGFPFPTHARSQQADNTSAFKLPSCKLPSCKLHNKEQQAPLRHAQLTLRHHLLRSVHPPYEPQVAAARHAARHLAAAAAQRSAAARGVAAVLRGVTHHQHVKEVVVDLGQGNKLVVSSQIG